MGRAEIRLLLPGGYVPNNCIDIPGEPAIRVTLAARTSLSSYARDVCQNSGREQPSV
jgi:hypothetical protein